MAKLAVRTFAFLLATCVVLLAHAAPEEKYPSKYDHIDVDAVLANPRLRNQYVECLMDTAPCNTGSARFLKERFAEAFVTRCRKCTDKQIYFFNTITDWFTKNEPDTWDILVKRVLNKIQNRSTHN